MSEESQLKSGSRKVIEWHNNLATFDKRVLWTFIGIVVVFLSISSTVSIIESLDNDISPQECSRRINNEVRQQLNIQEESPYLAFIYAFDIQFIWVLIAIGLAWILHGVGFHIIKR